MDLFSYLRSGSIRTPAYFFDAEEFRKRCRYVHSVLKEGIPLCFSVKANPFLVDPGRDTLERFEACSPGELSYLIDRKIPGGKIIYSGVVKQEEDIRKALDHDVLYITAESTGQFEKICAVLREKEGKKIRLLLRATSGNQFGMDREAMCTILKNRGSYPDITFSGIHYYSGTQKMTARKVSKDLERLKNLLEVLKDTCGYEPDLVEYGPGLGTEYFKENHEECDEALLKETAEILNEFAAHYPLGIEMGRFLAASSGYYVTKITDCKVNEADRYVLCDGGIHQIRYFGQNMAMQIPPLELLKMQDAKALRQDENTPLSGTVAPQHAGNAPLSGTDAPLQAGNALQQGSDALHPSETAPAVLCGSLCTTADVLVREVSLPDAAPGDYLVFGKCGAYSATEPGVLFLLRDLPSVYLMQENGPVLVRKALPSWRLV